MDEIPESDYPMIEEIILWNTLFEDRSIFKEKLERRYGDRLSAEQIKKIVKKRFTGWGRLSKKLLVELKSNTDNGPKSIMDILREGDQNSDHPSKAMVFMEILHDDNLAFNELIDEFNRKNMLDAGGLALENLPGSPALRRSINQALGIVDEIVRIAGHSPENIFIEVTREDDLESRGSRTKKRYERLEEAMKRFKEESPKFLEKDAWDKLLRCKSEKTDLDERLTLYFMQGGKSLYSNKPIDINRLYDDTKYQVDHIIPQSYIKDDSFDNKALVLSNENQNKSDQMLIDVSIRQEMRSRWDALLQAGLISKKKHANLLRDHISERQMKGFIARQLVETSQIMKIVQSFLKERYDGTNVLPVKAGLSSELRGKLELKKCREINDFHHAHDALLASEIGRFIQKRHPGMYDNPIAYTRALKSFIKKESELVRARHRIPGTVSFVIESFLKSNMTFDKDTGEVLEDEWSADRECTKLKKYFDYRQCFISRMPEETSGAFWDQTIYSPRGGKKSPAIPLKKGLNLKKYGGYSGTEFAYFFIYKAMKRGKCILEFASVPVSIASQIAKHEDALKEYAIILARDSGLEFVEIVRSKIYKYQLMEMEGSRLYLTGKKEARNATQFAFNRHETAIAKAIYDEDSIGKLDESSVEELFLLITESLMRYSPRLFSVLNIDSWKERFFVLGSEERSAVLKAMIMVGNGKANKVDLTPVGSSKFAGNMQPTYSKILTKGSGITFVDQSITGMFERRTHIGL